MSTRSGLPLERTTLCIKSSYAVMGAPFAAKQKKHPISPFPSVPRSPDLRADKRRKGPVPSEARTDRASDNPHALLYEWDYKSICLAVELPRAPPHAGTSGRRSPRQRRRPHDPGGSSGRRLSGGKSTHQLVNLSRKKFGTESKFNGPQTNPQ